MDSIFLRSFGGKEQKGMQSEEEKTKIFV